MTANSTKASPIGWLWNQARRVFQRVRGETVSRIVEPTPITRDRILEQSRKEGYTGELVDKLYNDKITLQQWQTDFRVRLKMSYVEEYMVSRGGKGAMTAADWDNLDRMLKKQYEYMDKFAADIAAGKLTPKQAQARMEMYFNSTTHANEVGKAASHGLPPLPAYPGDGQTICRVNCGCHWDIQETDTAWLCTWTLGATEHCPDCLVNADKWAPLVIPK